VEPIIRAVLVVLDVAARGVIHNLVAVDMEAILSQVEVVGELIPANK
jgi:hypothetical protein